jgi:AP-2 complex subunit alpha
MEKIEKRIEKLVTRAGTLSDAVLSGGSQSRGLQNFIAEIRNAKNKDEERARVDKELANIRAKFTSTANLTSYQKKKYVWKMCYISLLGYEVNFGHMECISLVSSSKFQEKSVGYMSVALLLRPGDELMMLAINSMRNDLTGHYDFGKCLALAAIANIGGMDFADTLCAEVQRAVVPFIADDPRRDAGVIHQVR